MIRFNRDNFKCDIENQKSLEITYYNYLNEALNCNIPWSRFKSRHWKDCSTEDHMKKYFELARKMDELKMNQHFENCNKYIWNPRDYYTDYSNEINRNSSTLTIGMIALDRKVWVQTFKDLINLLIQFILGGDCRRSGYLRICQFCWRLWWILGTAFRWKRSWTHCHLSFSFGQAHDIEKIPKSQKRPENVTRKASFRFHIFIIHSL